ncbi:MAG: beta-galactosidase trimerization domain-containing protein, partial [Bifidobacterium sp.]|nr:beta-galactosidase trimerization domain-containing protein [Bifidobacterium sp.]
MHRFYRPLWRRNIAVDVVESTTPAATLAGYDLVVAPVLTMVRPGVAENLTEYVRGGGRLVTGYMSGIHDEHDLVFVGGQPGPLRELCGVWVEEIDAFAPGDGVDVLVGADDGAAPAVAAVEARGEIVASILEPEGARPVATYGGRDFYTGTPAVTVNTVGEGRVWFVGTALDEAGMRAVMDAAVADAGVEAIDTPDGIEVMRRVADDGTVYT